MSAQTNKTFFFSSPTLLLAAVFLLPSLEPSFFGLINGILAVPVLYTLRNFGPGRGAVILRNALLVAGGGALLLQHIEVFLFSLTLAPLGFSLNRSVDVGESAAVAGGKGSVVLALSWFVFWAGFGVLAEIHPYRQLIELLDAGFAQTYEIYSKNTDLSADVLLNLEQAVTQLRELVPRVLPGVLAGTVLLTVWMNMVAANIFLGLKTPENSPWPRYSTWRLPEQLVWIPIVSSVLILTGSGIVRDIGICLVLVSCMVYFFQGVAVFIHLLDRWNVPRYIRVLLYFILVIQSFGLLLLAVLGIADVWINFRQREQNDHST
ncbi:MAG: DUF2232 domain-containing protein [Desulfobulbaceae bacterium]|nr:DUF2232 domain-containing protein [Desulfobulbaceae bacterium]